MATWEEFAKANPELAAHGKRTLQLGKEYGSFEGGLAYLATIRKDGGPRVHPISPVLRNGRLYAFVLKRSPKKDDLLRDGRYALHSFPHPMGEDSFNDEEFYVTGRATLVEDPAIRQAVADGCGDSVETGLIFELGIERALHKDRSNRASLYTKWKDGP